MPRGIQLQGGISNVQRHLGLSFDYGGRELVNFTTAIYDFLHLMAANPMHCSPTNLLKWLKSLQYFHVAQEAEYITNRTVRAATMQDVDIFCRSAGTQCSADQIDALVNVTNLEFTLVHVSLKKGY